METRQFNQTSYSQGGQFGGPIGQQRSLITRVNTVREREPIEGGSTEILERDVVSAVFYSLFSGHFSQHHVMLILIIFSNLIHYFYKGFFFFHQGAK